MYAKQKNVHNKLFFVDPTSRLDIFQTIISVCHSTLCKIIKILLSAWDFDVLHIKNIIRRDKISHSIVSRFDLECLHCFCAKSN